MSIPVVVALLQWRIQGKRLVGIQLMKNLLLPRDVKKNLKVFQLQGEEGSLPDFSTKGICFWIGVGVVIFTVWRPVKVYI